MELSIQHRTLGPRKHEAAISFYSQGRQSLRAQCGFEFGVKDEDRKSIRWYLEDYLQYPVDPAPQIAAGVERRMAAIGEELFQVVFGSPEARAIWTAARPHIGKLRVAVETDVAGDTTVPWELLRERKGRPLALSARAFVRSAAGSEEVTYQPGPETDQVRILLVISRPRGQEDVPFRSVAGRILAAAQAAGVTRAHIDVLRPPTFEQLGRVLRQAAFEQAPYHIVHFDGHGTYDDVSRLDPSALFAIREAGPRGFLLFENPAAAGNVQYLDGTTLGQLLTETGVGALVLNACRSTYAEPAPAPSTTDAEEPSDIPAFGSLAQELLASGVPAVLAMRYTIYVVTAAEYMAGFYEALSRGYTFGEAASYARKQLAADQLRQIAFDPVAFQDWSVPVVYERKKPVRLLPRRSGPVRPIRIEAKQGIAPPIGFEMRLPPRPDAGFFGRDETILALDRSFDSNNIVLLHAYAGSGKTAAAAEFARWYWATGGINGPVLFTSFATRLPLTRALDHFHEAFRQELESAGKQWLAIPDQERPQHALEFLQTHEALWIWDNVEPVTGFPAGTASSWSDEEQDELRDFLQRAAGGKLRVLLTSRRDEQAWLGELPARVALPRLAFQETVQLTRELAQRRGKRITDVQDWRPLIAFTQGNPLTISMLVGQALRQRLHTRQEIDGFLAELRRGASQIQDDAELGRSRSLAASLNYGFEHAFTEEQRMQLSVLHLFEGFVGVKDVLQMAIRSALGGVARLRELTETSALALLDRAAEIGMLSHEGNGFYTMHPMLPWFLTAAFEKYCGHEREEVLQGFAVAYAINSVQLANQFDEGQHLSAANLLFREEANLLRALEYARQNQWKLAVSGLLQGLKRLYHYLGRQSEWARIVSEIVPLFCDAATERPLPDSEREWTFIMDHRVRLAYESGQWHEAERLQRICIEWDRKAAEAALLKASGDRSEEEEQAIRLLAQSYELWADILRELHREDCVAAYRDALQLYREINDSPLNAAFGLGQAYLAVDGIRDLDKARACFAGIITQPETPNHLRGRSLIQLGTIAWMRSEESETEADAQQNLDKALACFSAAEKLLPTTELRELAALKNQTSIVLVRLDRPAEAAAHCEQAIRLFERMGQSSNALIARANLARALLNAGRHDEALAYAKAVYNDCQAAGDEQSDAFETAFSVLTDINDLQGRSAAGAE